jgi:hypothetical protein
LVPQAQTISEIVRVNLKNEHSSEKRKYATRLMMDALMLTQESGFLEMKQHQFDVEIKLL